MAFKLLIGSLYDQSTGAEQNTWWSKQIGAPKEGKDLEQ
jgi:hypothetical protein